ncbi:hypothetical protein B296_00000980, partial [Ensete ventricosum]
MLPNVRKMRSMDKIVSWDPTAVASDVGIGQKSYKKQKWRDPSAVPTFAGPARPKDGPLRLRQSDTAKVVSQPQATARRGDEDGERRRRLDDAELENGGGGESHQKPQRGGEATEAADQRPPRHPQEPAPRGHQSKFHGCIHASTCFKGVQVWPLLTDCVGAVGQGGAAGGGGEAGAGAAGEGGGGGGGGAR